MTHESVHIFLDSGKAFGRAAFAGRPAMAARVPRKQGDITEPEKRDGFLPATRMFVPPMKQ